MSFPISYHKLTRNPIKCLIPFEINKTRYHYQISILTWQFLHSRITVLVLFDITENFLAPQFLQTGQALSPFVMGYPEAFVYNEDGAVKITVLSNEGHSSKMAEEITHYVMTSWKDAKAVNITFTGDMEWIWKMKALDRVFFLLYRR